NRLSLLETSFGLSQRLRFPLGSVRRFFDFERLVVQLILIPPDTASRNGKHDDGGQCIRGIRRAAAFEFDSGCCHRGTLAFRFGFPKKVYANHSDSKLLRASPTAT